VGKPFFSIGIIFKNEIRCLERCLKSLQPLRDAVPCELVMADTGSDDGSREVAARYADILFDFPWVDDFSAARNAVMDRCSGQWYFTIDADEWLTEDIRELIAFSREKKLPHDFGSINIRNYKSVDLDEKQHNDFAGIRLLRMSTGIRYTGCIHEKWAPPTGETVKAMMLCNTWLNHDGYAYVDDAAEQAKHDRNIALLRKKLAENPEDMQTLVECIDVSKYDTEGIGFARKAVEVLDKRPPRWERYGPTVMRGAVSAAKLQKMPELGEWISKAAELFPNSIFIRTDVAYYALVDCSDRGDYAGVIRWGEMYRDALSDYCAGNYDHSELLRGGLELVSPYWERKVLIVMAHAYLECDDPEKAFDALRDIKGGDIEDLKQVESIVQIMMRLHRTALLDTPSLMAAFWEQINQPVSSEELAKKRRAAFLSTASTSFPQKYRAEELGRKDFIRHGYTLFTCLEGECALGMAAAMLEMGEPKLLEEKLSGVKDWNELPISAFAHALDCGIAFPLPGRMMNIEEMDGLASRLAREADTFDLLRRATEKPFEQDRRSLAWVRGLAMAAVRTFDWKAKESDAQRGMEIAKIFAHVEGKFLTLCYSPDVLSSEMVFLLPPMHRFGWYCARAFDALDAGDAAGYVHLLREGLESCNEMKPMVEFLLDNTSELKCPSNELGKMADQVREILSQFSPDDPAVTAIKQTEAYKKVAYLIEGTEVPVVGGLRQ